jgi:hypothetical protein
MADTATPPAAAEVNEFDAMIATLDAPSDAPISVASTGTDLEAFQAPAPVAEPPPALSPALAAAADPPPAEPNPAPAEPAPTPAPLDPTKEIDPNLATNWRISAQSALEQTTLKIYRTAQTQNKPMSLGEAEKEAYRQLGLPLAADAAPAPNPAEPTPAEPTAPASPLAAVDADVAAIRAQIRDLNPVLDKELIDDLTEKKDALIFKRGELAADLRVQQVLQEREEVAEAEVAGQAQFEEVAAKFEDLKDPNSPFFLTFAQLHDANVASNSPALADPDYERKLAATVAGQFLLEGKPFKVKSAALAPAAAPAPTGTPPAATPPAVTRTAPAPAPMAALPGNHAAPTSEHRVTVQPVDSSQVHQIALQQAYQKGGIEDVLGALNAELGGQEPEGLRILSIG